MLTHRRCLRETECLFRCLLERGILFVDSRPTRFFPRKHFRDTNDFLAISDEKIPSIKLSFDQSPLPAVRCARDNTSADILHRHDLTVRPKLSLLRYFRSNRRSRYIRPAALPHRRT